MRRRARVDQNQTEIVQALRKAGCSVVSIASVGSGCPDLLVGVNGRNVLLEVKAKKGTSTEDQITWGASWKGQAAIVRSAEEAMQAVRGEP